jgi:tight adherence protein C
VSSFALLIVGLTAIFIGLAGAVSVIALTGDRPTALKSLALLEAFSTAPQQLRDELQPGFTDRVLTPLLNRLLGIGRRLTPADYAVRAQHKLDVAGNPHGLTADRLISLQTLGFGAGLLGSLIVTVLLNMSTTTAVLVGVALAVAGYFAPALWLYQRGHDRSQQMQRELPDSLDLLTISVEAGLGFNAAVAQVARNTEGPLSEELSRVIQEMQIGLSRSQALRALADRTPLPELKEFVTAMVQADEFGIPISKVLRVQSAEMRI